MLTQTFKRDQTEKISAAQAEQRLGAIFRDGIEPDALKRLTVNGRRAVVQVLEDLADQFPDVADRIAEIVHYTGKGSRTMVAAHFPPRNIVTSTTPLASGQMPTKSLKNGYLTFKHAFTDNQKLRRINHQAMPERYRINDSSFSAGFRTVNSPHFSAGSADDFLGHTVAHEFGHAVHGLAQDIMYFTREGILETRNKDVRRRLLQEKINEALDEANLPRQRGDIAENISHYASTNEAETFAEAFAEVYNLGTEARPHARTIVNAVLKVIDDFGGELP